MDLAIPTWRGRAHSLNYRGPIADSERRAFVPAGATASNSSILLCSRLYMPALAASTASRHWCAVSSASNFASPKDLFDAAFRDHALFFADIRLRELAIAKFKSLPFHTKLVLFYNYDPRILRDARLPARSH
jgi:hypothetical protein